MNSWAPISEKSFYPNSPKGPSPGNELTSNKSEQAVWVYAAKFLQAPQRTIAKTRPRRTGTDARAQRTWQDKMPRLGTRKLKYRMALQGLNYGRDRLFDLLRRNRL